MDAGDRTLNGILKSIAAENDLVGYNTYRNRQGRIIVKISYQEPSEKCDQQEKSNDGFDKSRISFKKMSETQLKRQYHRTRNFTKNLKTSWSYSSWFHIDSSISWLGIRVSFNIF